MSASGVPKSTHTQPPSSIDREVDAHIHMLGCQGMTEARNLGYAEGKGTKEDDGDLLDMIDKHEKLLSQAITSSITRARVEELNLLDDALFPPPYKRINFTKLKEYKSERIKELEDNLTTIGVNDE